MLQMNEHEGVLKLQLAWDPSSTLGNLLPMPQQKPGTSRRMQKRKNKRYDLYLSIQTDLTWGAEHYEMVINATGSC